MGTEREISVVPGPQVSVSSETMAQWQRWKSNMEAQFPCDWCDMWCDNAAETQCSGLGKLYQCISNVRPNNVSVCKPSFQDTESGGYLPI